MPSTAKRDISADSQDEETDNLSDVELPDLDNPYSTLDVAEDATEEQIKKSYRKLSLKHHPDKAAEADKATATATFQKLTAAYALLSDPRRRARYDSTGDASETLLDDDDFNWSDFFREQFKESITTEKIESFAKSYKGSDEERKDVLKAYMHKSVKGKMNSLYEYVMLSSMLDDEERFRAIIDTAIENGEAEAYPAYTEETATQRDKRMERAQREAESEAREATEESEKARKKQTKKSGAGSSGKAAKTDSLDSLAALIQGKNKGRSENFLANLEAKYGAKEASKKGKKRGKVEIEPTDEEFEAIQAKLQRQK